MTHIIEAAAKVALALLITAGLAVATGMVAGLVYRGFCFVVGW